MIEILVAIGIIATLSALLFLGFKHVSHAARGDATNATLQTLRGMVTEFETSAGSNDKLERLYDSTAYAASPPPPDFKPTPPEFPLDFQIRAPLLTMTLDAPGGSRNDRVVKKTRLVMARLLSVPANASVLNSLPPSSVDRNADGVVLLDAHGNPIIYVPSRGITGVNLGVNGQTKTATTGWDKMNQTMPGVDGRHGYWLSAGDDGRFDQGDDNESTVGR